MDKKKTKVVKVATTEEASPPESKRSRLKAASLNLLGPHGLAPVNSTRLL